jgi:hypothetical protein
MKITEIVKQLKDLKKLHGNVDVTIMDMNGDWVPIKDLIKVHPSAQNGGYDRTKPVSNIGLVTSKWNCF